MVVGDQGNDQCWLMQAPVAWIMPFLNLKIAKVITKSNHLGQDGVAYAIENMHSINKIL